MSIRVLARSILVALAVALGAGHVADARDGDDRRFVRRTHHERSSLDERRSGVRLQADRDAPRYQTDRGWHHRDGRERRVPDYRVVRGSFDDGARHRDPRPRWRESEWRRTMRWRAPASVIVGSGRFSGNVDSWYDRGAGSYFSIARNDRGGWRGDEDGRVPAAEGRGVRSRVIAVDPRRNDAACSFEAGVCVIRGR